MLKQDSHNFGQNTSSRVLVHSLHKLDEGKETLIPLHQDQKEPLPHTSSLQYFGNGFLQMENMMYMLLEVK